MSDREHADADEAGDDDVRALRADLYDFLGGLFADAPDAERLATIASLEGDDAEIGQALRALAFAADMSTPEDVAAERAAVFAGLARPEADVASLFSVMAGLLRGRLGPPADLATQKKYFRTELAPWAPRFFDRLAEDDAAPFYAAAAALAAQLIAMERAAFEDEDAR